MGVEVVEKNRGQRVVPDKNIGLGLPIHELLKAKPTQAVDTQSR